MLMKKVRTESGSVYMIDEENRTLSRLSEIPLVSVGYTEGIEYNPNEVRIIRLDEMRIGVGIRADLAGPPFHILSTPVVEIIEE